MLGSARHKKVHGIIIIVTFACLSPGLIRTYLAYLLVLRLDGRMYLYVHLCMGGSGSDGWIVDGRDK